MTGAGGFIGRHVAARLNEQGHRVLALSRGIAPEDRTDGVMGPADLAEIEAWKAWPEGTDVLIHLGALNPSRSEPQSGDLAALRRANVEATAALARRAARERVRRMLFISSANVHGPSADKSVSASDPLAPASPYAISKAEAEAAFWTSLSGTETEGCVLRPAPVYGAGGRGNVAVLVKLASMPAPLPLEGLGGPRSLVAVDHLAQVIAASLEVPAAAGTTILIADEGPITPAGIVRALRTGWGRAPLLLPAPVGVLQRLIGAMGKDTVWRAATAPFVLETQPLKDLLGWSSPLTTQEKLRRLAADGAL